MRTKRVSFSVFLWYKIIALSYLFNIIIFSALKYNIQKALTNMIILVIISVGLTLAAMILNRIIMGNFGSFLHGLLIFLFLNSINYFVTIFLVFRTLSLIISFSYLIGIIFFIIHKKFITFDSSKSNKKEKKKIPINKKLILKILCVIIIMIVIYNLFIYFFCVKIYFSAYAQDYDGAIKIVIKIKFPEKISILKEDIEPFLKNQKNISDNSNLVIIKPDVQYLKITPPINGRYRFENQNTIIFIPDTDLKPSTEYKVKLLTDKIKIKKKFILGKNFKFHTPQFAVTGTNIFYNMDLSSCTLNLYLFDVTIKKVFKNNLAYFLKNSDKSQTLLNKPINTEDGKENQIVPQFINVKKFHNMKYKGLFKIKLSDPKSCWNFNQKYILCTDLEIIAKYSGKDLIVRVCSVKNLIPQSGIKIKLVSKKNQVIKQGITDESGSLVIKDWKIFYYNYSPYFLLAEMGNDFSFLKFRDLEKDHTPVNTGRKVISEKGMKALLTPEKGVYRPGEKAYITVIVRKDDLSSLSPVNVQLYITDPLGEKFKILKKKIPPKGIMSFEIFFPAHVKTGEYTLTLQLNENIKLGRTYIKIKNLSQGR